MGNVTTSGSFGMYLYLQQIASSLIYSLILIANIICCINILLQRIPLTTWVKGLSLTVLGASIVWKSCQFLANYYFSIENENSGMFFNSLGDLLSSISLFFHFLCQIQIIQAFSILTTWLSQRVIRIIIIGESILALLDVVFTIVKFQSGIDWELISHTIGLIHTLYLFCYEIMHNLTIVRLLDELRRTRSQQSELLIKMRRLSMMVWFVDISAWIIYVVYILMDGLYSVDVIVLYAICSSFLSSHYILTVYFNSDLRKLKFGKQAQLAPIGSGASTKVADENETVIG